MLGSFTIKYYLCNGNGIVGSSYPMIRFPHFTFPFPFLLKLTNADYIKCEVKIVFFRQLLLDDVTRQWTAAQQIVYSHLLSQSILRLDSVFHADGTNIDYVEVINDYCDEDGEIDLDDYNVQNLSNLLNLSRQKIYDSIEFLRRKRYIHDDFIYCPKEIIYHGYFELKMDSGLSKQLLIFYSWLYERGQPYDGTVDTYSYRLAELFGTNENNIRAMIFRLASKGYVRRINSEDKRYGKLKLLRQ